MERGMEQPQRKIDGCKNNNVKEETHVAAIFGMMKITECYSKIGSEFYPDDSLVFIYGTKKFNEVFEDIVRFKKILMGCLKK